ncbi:MAG: tetratricopeptide repeat protein [Rubrobacter sp.]|nr:tetratricopeptide repeat protein [Rubrobacter sp.]
MNFLYPTLGALLILAGFLFFVGRQNRDLLRARAYGEFLVRLLPLLSTGVLVLGLPLIMDLATVENTMPVLIAYLGGTAVLTVLMARLAAPEERRAGALFRSEEYEGAAATYERLLSRRPLPRYYSALGASLDILGEHRRALEATSQAIKLDPKLGIAYYNRASTLAALGQRERAHSDLQTIFRVDSSRRLRRAARQALATLEKGWLT